MKQDLYQQGPVAKIAGLIAEKMSMNLEYHVDRKHRENTVLMATQYDTVFPRKGTHMNRPSKDFSIHIDKK